MYKRIAIVVFTIALAVVVFVAVAFLSLWLANLIGIQDEFIQLVDSSLSSPVVVTIIIVGVLVWFVNKFYEEVSETISRIKKIGGGGIEAYPKRHMLEQKSTTTASLEKTKVDERLTTKDPASDSATTDKEKSGAEPIAKTAAEGDSFAEIKEKAEAGDAKAQNDLGVMYYNGQSVVQDYKEAERWLRRAAEQGHTNAQFNLGVMYQNGQGVEKDFAQALKWYRLAAEQGTAIAQNNLGLMYHDGQGVAQDYAEAMKWYRLAAKQGDADAQFNLGVMYDNGQGVVQNDKEAVKWYRRAAEQGDADAQFNLGVMYDNGQGVVQNDKEAVKWYRLAAEQGTADAQFNLGVMYHKGQGVAQNYKEAYIWHSIAAANGEEDSVKYRNNNAKLLSAGDLAQAQAEATRRLEKIREKQAKSEE